MRTVRLLRAVRGWAFRALLTIEATAGGWELVGAVIGLGLALAMHGFGVF